MRKNKTSLLLGEIWYSRRQSTKRLGSRETQMNTHILQKYYTQAAMLLKKEYTLPTIDLDKLAEILYNRYKNEDGS